MPINNRQIKVVENFNLRKKGLDAALSVNIMSPDFSKQVYFKLNNNEDIEIYRNGSSSPIVLLNAQNSISAIGDGSIDLIKIKTAVSPIEGSVLGISGGLLSYISVASPLTIGGLSPITNVSLVGASIVESSPGFHTLTVSPSSLQNDSSPKLLANLDVGGLSTTIRNSTTSTSIFTSSSDTVFNDPSASFLSGTLVEPGDIVALSISGGPVQYVEISSIPSPTSLVSGGGFPSISGSPSISYSIIRRPNRKIFNSRRDLNWFGGGAILFPNLVRIDSSDIEIGQGGHITISGTSSKIRTGASSQDPFIFLNKGVSPKIDFGTGASSSPLFSIKVGASATGDILINTGSSIFESKSMSESLKTSLGTLPTTNQILKYNGSSVVWADPASFSFSPNTIPINSLSTAGASEGDIVRFVSGAWARSTFPSIGNRTFIHASALSARSAAPSVAVGDSIVIDDNTQLPNSVANPPNCWCIKVGSNRWMQLTYGSSGDSALSFKTDSTIGGAY